MPTPLQSNSKAAVSATTTQTCAFTSNLSAGTKVLCYVSSSTQTGGSATSQISGVQDGGGHTLTLAARSQFLSGANVLYDLTIWFMDTPPADVGTTPTLTATLGSGTSEIAMLVQEVPGLLPGSAVEDGTAATLHGSGTTFSTGGTTYGWSYIGEYFVTVYGDDGGPLTWTSPGAPLTIDAKSLNTQSTANLAVGYANTIIGTIGDSWSVTGSTTADWAQISTAFRLALPAAGKRSGPGRTSTTRGRSASSRGVPPPPPATTAAPFIPPRRPSTGAAAARRGRSPSGTSSRGAPVVPTPPPPIFGQGTSGGTIRDSRPYSGYGEISGIPGRGAVLERPAGRGYVGQHPERADDLEHDWETADDVGGLADELAGPTVAEVARDEIARAGRGLAAAAKILAPEPYAVRPQAKRCTGEKRVGGRLLRCSRGVHADGMHEADGLYWR